MMIRIGLLLILAVKATALLPFEGIGRLTTFEVVESRQLQTWFTELSPLLYPPDSFTVQPFSTCTGYPVDGGDSVTPGSPWYGGVGVKDGGLISKDGMPEVRLVRAVYLNETDGTGWHWGILVEDGEFRISDLVGQTPEGVLGNVFGSG